MKRARNRDPARRRAICVLSPHPLVLAELSRLLSGPRLRVLTYRLPPTPRWKGHGLKLVPASVYLVDALFPDTSAEAAIRQIRGRFPRARILVLTDSLDEARAFALLELGVKGLLSYKAAPGQLGNAVEVALEGGFWVPRALLSRFVDSVLRGMQRRGRFMSRSHVSEREREILDAVLNNLSNKEIAAELHISERTVKFHVSNLLAKLDARSRQELIVRCFQGAPADGARPVLRSR